MRAGLCGMVILNRPKALNALNLPMIRSMYPEYQILEKANSTKLVILAGSGDKAFCAGGDVKALYLEGVNQEGGSLRKDFFREEYQLNYLIGTFQKPHIALLDGVTMGGGVGLSVHGQFRIATERTVFAMPETGIGFYTDVGGSYFLPRLKGQLGMYLGLTGERLKGEDVKRAGIATHFIESSSIDLVIDRLKALSPETLDGSKAAMKSLNLVLGELDASSGEESQLLTSTRLEEIDRCFGRNSVEEIFEALGREGTEWASKTLAKLKTMSPTSLKVVFRGIRKGANLSLADCLRQEYRISQHMMFHGKDFYEGIRSVLVDRDGNPQWNPSSLDQVTEEVVARYFEPLPAAEELSLPEQR